MVQMSVTSRGTTSTSRRKTQRDANHQVTSNRTARRASCCWMWGVAVGLFERLPEGAHGWGEVGEFLEVSFGERVELGRPRLCERDAHDTLAGGVGVALDEPVADRAVDQADCTVVAKHEV